VGGGELELLKSLREQGGGPGAHLRKQEGRRTRMSWSRSPCCHAGVVLVQNRFYK
jgi:hypothetical protein